jgi:hypothetical protein
MVIPVSFSYYQQLLYGHSFHTFFSAVFLSNADEYLWFY